MFNVIKCTIFELKVQVNLKNQLINLILYKKKNRYYYNFIWAHNIIQVHCICYMKSDILVFHLWHSWNSSIDTQKHILLLFLWRSVSVP